MFHSARLKLTAWYLLIIMVISLSFSTVIYRMFSAEVERFARVQRVRIEHGLNSNMAPLPPDDGQIAPLPVVFDDALVSEVQQRVIGFLTIVNVGVLVLSGGLGYFLAGRTLKPIAEMVDEQHRFISDASHELRTPLTALKSSMEVNLRDPDLTLAGAKTLMKESITDVNKLQSLSDALLQLAQYEKPSIVNAFAKTQVTDIAEAAIRKVSSLAKQKKISIENLTQPTIIEGDKFSLTDLFVILLDNAIKYSPKESTITVRSKRTDGSILLSVVDHGQGINETDLPKIFDRFYRADTARSKVHADGYGLGLSIAKKIVQSHQGSIQVVSILKKGTTFTVRLPVKQNKNMS